MFNVATVFSRRIEYIFRGHKNAHKKSGKNLINTINIQRIARVHPALFYLVAYLGLPLGIMCTVFFAAYVTVAPLSFLMGWM